MLANTIMAAVAVDTRRTEVREFGRPAMRADNGMLRVEVTGMCGADWPFYQTLPSTKGPVILGHETVGVVCELGAEASARWGVKEGDRVALKNTCRAGTASIAAAGISGFAR